MRTIRGIVVAAVLGVLIGVGTVLSVGSLLGQEQVRGVPAAQVLDYGTR